MRTIENANNQRKIGKINEMKQPQRPINLYDNYHAHVYFDHKTVEFAAKLCEKAGDLFNLKIGRVHQKLVGPHPCWSCQILFASNDFEQLIPWLEESRQGLSIFVHPLTGNDLDDHTKYACWLGDECELNVDMFRR